MVGRDLVMTLGFWSLPANPVKRMVLLDDAVDAITRGVFSVGVASGAAPEEMIAVFHAQMLRMIGEAPSSVNTRAAVNAGHALHSMLTTTLEEVA